VWQGCAGTAVQASSHPDRDGSLPWRGTLTAIALLQAASFVFVIFFSNLVLVEIH
jgi:hypothetical protein